MADNQVNWVMNLVDNITKPLKDILKMMPKIGTSISKNESELQGFNNELNQTNKTAQKTESLFNKLGRTSFNLNNISQSISQFNDGFLQLNQSSESFELGMRKANTMAQLGQDDFLKLSESVRNVGDNVGITRDLLTDGLYQTISVGVPQNNWMDFLENSSKTSVGAVADLGATVKVTSTLIKNYGLEWDKSTEIQDKIQKTATLGVTSFEELAQALPNVTGAAATLKVSTDELFGSFATLTGVSGTTNTVSTQLAAIYNSLIKPSSEATKLAKNMGVAFDARSIEKSGGMIPFFKQISSEVEIYAEKTGKLPENIYATLFGSSEAMKAILPLTGELADSFTEKTNEIANSAGTIDKAYSEMASTTVVESQRMQNVIDNFKDNIFELTKSYLPLMKVGGQAFSQVSQLAPGIMLLGNSFKALGKGISNAIPALRAFNISMLANPVVAVVAAVVAYTAAIVGIIVYWEELTNWFERQAGWVKILVGVFAALNLWLVAIIAVTKVLVDNWADITSFFENLPLIVDAAVKIVTQRWRVMFRDMQATFLEIKDWLIENHPVAIFLNKMDEMFPFIRERFIAIFDAFYNSLIKPIQEALSAVFDWTFSGSDGAPGEPTSSTGASSNAEKKASSGGLTPFASGGGVMTKTAGSGISKNIESEKTTGNRILNIEKLVEKIEIHTTKLSESPERLKQEIIKVLMSATNDVVNA